jgi:putative thioredoxin
MLLNPETPARGPSLDFERDVVEASRRTPQLVDFWAPWCGPCRALTPVLEKLAAEADGRWSLVKINSDEHPELAQQSGVRGIPAVKLFVDGRIAAEFTGALPEQVVRRWLEEHLPTEEKRLLEHAKARLVAGERDAARPLLEELVATRSDDEEARALLACLVALEDTGRAAKLVEGLAHRPEAEAVNTLHRFCRLADAPEELPEAEVKEDYVAAAQALRHGDADGALDTLIRIVQKDRSFDDDGARRAVVALFTVLGESDPVVRRHRPVFDRSLY